MKKIKTFEDLKDFREQQVKSILKDAKDAGLTLEDVKAFDWAIVEQLKNDYIKKLWDEV